MRLTIAAAKGYLLTKTIEKLNALGYTFTDDAHTTRKLFIDDTTQTLRLLLIRPWDVPVYVSQGAADLGVVGKDILLEQAPNVLTLCDLGFGACKLVIAGPKPIEPKQLVHHLKVATKFTHSTHSIFNKKGSM